jgi:hypothetical protein
MRYANGREESQMNTLRSSVLTAVVAAAAVGGFALGRESESSRVARFVTPVSAATVAAGPASYPTHDDSVPDSADSFSHQHLPDADAAPTF